VGKSAVAVGGGMHGFPAALTSFIGRSGAVREVADLLEQYPLVTVTGPGGAGKTRLAAEVAKQVADRFADGVWLVELAPVADPGQVPAMMAAALGVREQPGVPAAEALARALARQQLLLVLDNCEHVIAAAAELCAGLLLACDELRILATSREPLQVAGEARYRLVPLSLPADDGESEAVALFTDRARRADAHFTLDDQTAPSVARLVTRLDGMPLAIELAAARVEALGVAQLLDLLDDRFALLVGADRAAPVRHQSLAATVEWSYQLLTGPEQRVFRALAAFPGPFTLQGAEAIAGEGAGPAVLRLVDCSLLVPPRAGPDGRSRYLMLDTLRAYGTRRLAEAGEQDGVAGALAEYALGVAGEAAAGLATGDGERAAVQRLDAEDATMRQVLAWAMGHDTTVALRLAVALVPWWFVRGRAPGEYPVLRQAAEDSQPGGEAWCTAQFWLGETALYAGDVDAAFGHFSEVCDALRDRGPSRGLARCLGGRSVTLSNLGRIAEAVEAGQQSMAMAREVDDPVGQSLALADLAIAAEYAGDLDAALELVQRAEQIPDLPGWIARKRSNLLAQMLTETGELDAAEDICSAALAMSRDAGDVWNQAAVLILMADLDQRAGRFGEASARLQESLQITTRTGGWFELSNILAHCGYLCAATGRYAEAATLWAASGLHETSVEDAPWMRRQREAVRAAREVLGADRARAAEERGAAMTAATAAEYVRLLTSPAPSAGPPDQVPGQLSARERELVVLVAQGRTDAEIAAQLFISVHTVGSHLDRIRDKTGCRRRADLTRLALRTGLL
jgi:predicted ATPase/DNA-binding CsgD family transcriptional regulator